MLFLDQLATTLEEASIESLKQFSAHSFKAGTYVSEVRDTSKLAVITQMLMALLEANGCRTFPPTLRKRVRDEVSWTDGAIEPW